MLSLSITIGISLKLFKNSCYLFLDNILDLKYNYTIFYIEFTLSFIELTFSIFYYKCYYYVFNFF